MNTLMVLMGVAMLFVSMEVSFAALTDLDPCLEDDDCSDVAGAECVRYNGCNNGTCKCMDDYTEVEGACKATKTENEDCTENTDMCVSADNSLTCRGDPTKCLCPENEEWNADFMMCFAEDEYIALGESCTAGQDGPCGAHDPTNTAAYGCIGDTGSETCQCRENFFQDSESDPKKCQKKQRNEDCEQVTGDVNVQCDSVAMLECIAESEDEGAATHCKCPDSKTWNMRAGQCVTGSAHDQAVGTDCTEHNQCSNNLMCDRCPTDADTVSKECRSLMSGGGGSSSSEDTSGAAHLAAGVATIILSAVAMFL